MRNVLLSLSSLLFLALMLVTTGCSNDDEVRISSDDNENEQIVNVDFYLTNDSGERAVVFSYGEDITFNLDIENKTKEKYTIPCLEDVIDFTPSVKPLKEPAAPDLFAVYTMDGTLVGYAWDELVIDQEVIIKPLSSLHSAIHWQKVGTKHNLNHKYMKLQRHDPLPKGSYYVLYVLYEQNDKFTTYKVEFVVDGSV